MNLSDITPLILTFNEEDNLDATLSSLTWATRIIVVDSGSTDGTVSLAAQFPNVHLVYREFDNHTNQWNFGLSLIQSTWVLALDADYKCPSELRAELMEIDSKYDVYFSRFRYCVFGRPLRGALYPPRPVLFMPDKRKYVQDGHTQLLTLRDAEIGHLRSTIRHDDRKSLTRWGNEQIKYAILEADKLLSSSSASLGWKDRIRRKIVFAPLLTLIYCLFIKRLVLDGWPGIFYTLQRVFAELTLSLVLLDRKIRE